jgi:hypothetical protein
MAKSNYPTEDRIRTALIQRVDRFCRLTGASPTAVGKQAVNDTAFIHDIRSGKNFTVDRYSRVMAWLDKKWPETEAVR